MCCCCSCCCVTTGDDDADAAVKVATSTSLRRVPAEKAIVGGADACCRCSRVDSTAPRHLTNTSASSNAPDGSCDILRNRAASSGGLEGCMASTLSNKLESTGGVRSLAFTVPLPPMPPPLIVLLLLVTLVTTGERCCGGSGLTATAAVPS